MPKNIIIMNDKGDINRFYYDKNRGICSKNGVFAEDGTEDFDAVYWKNTEHLLYKSRNNSIIYIGSNGKRTLLAPKSRTSPNASEISLAAYKKNLIGFYMLRRKNEIMLCCQNLSENSMPQVVDSCSSLKYSISSNPNGNLYVCYVKGAAREIVIREFNGSWQAIRKCEIKITDSPTLLSISGCGSRFLLTSNSAQKNRI